MLKFICYPKCTTCQKAKKWLDDNGVNYELRDIKLDNPSLDELTKWYRVRIVEIYIQSTFIKVQVCYRFVLFGFENPLKETTSGKIVYKAS